MKRAREYTAKTRYLALALSSVCHWLRRLRQCRGVFEWCRHPRLRVGLVLALVLLIGSSCAEAQTDRAVSSIKSAREKLRPLHQKMGPPQPGDWLGSYPGQGQTFEQYLAALPVTPTGRRRTIYLLPLGDFTEKQQEVVKLTGEYLGLCYNRPVKSLAPFPLAKVPQAAQRVRPGAAAAPPPPEAESPVPPSVIPETLEPPAPNPEDIQILTTWLLDDLLPKRLPEDGAALIALTASDLWPGPGWNFVFGQASLQKRVGVWSINRNGNPARNEEEFRLCLRRTLKTASHELGHMFTIQHCTAYECGMCGSNNRSEADRRPLAFCPECTAKICWATQADPRTHLSKLAEFCQKHGLEEDEKFYQDSAAALAPEP